MRDIGNLFGILTAVLFGIAVLNYFIKLSTANG